MSGLWLAVTLVCAGFVQGLSGFGFGLVSMSLMPLFMGVKQAAVISTAFSLLATVSIFARHYRDYNWRQGAVFLASVCVGVPVGVYFLEQGSEKLLVRVLGGVMLVYAAREFLLPARAEHFPLLWTVPLGLFSGTMSGAFNLGGMPTAAYAYSQSWSRGQIMSFLQVMITLSCTLRMLLYYKTGLLLGIPWRMAIVMVIPAYAAIWLGQVALLHIQPRLLRRGVFVFVGISGLYYLFLH
jgi:uncharacterized protein